MGTTTTKRRTRDAYRMDRHRPHGPPHGGEPHPQGVRRDGAEPQPGQGARARRDGRDRRASRSPRWALSWTRCTPACRRPLSWSRCSPATGGVLERPKQGLIVVDHSTIHPDAARALAASRPRTRRVVHRRPGLRLRPGRRAGRDDHHVRRRRGRVRRRAPRDGGDGAHRRADGRVRFRRGDQGW